MVEYKKKNCCIQKIPKSAMWLAQVYLHLSINQNILVGTAFKRHLDDNFNKTFINTLLR